MTIVLLQLIYGCSNISIYPISAPSEHVVEDRVIAKWKFLEDTNTHNFYEVYQAHVNYPNQYHIRFWNRGGTNPTYESNGHFSKIDDEQFFNLPYFEPGTNGTFFQNEGYIFLRLLDVNNEFDKITASVVGDTTMRQLRNSEEVLNYVKKNLNNPKFYSDTIHLIKFK